MSLFPHMNVPPPNPPTVTIRPTAQPYPCDRGTGRPVGYHHFQTSPSGVTACTFCGKRPEGA